MILSVFFAGLLVILLGYWLIPKGNLCYELLRLPQYWYYVYKVDISKMKTIKYPYGLQRRQYFYCCEPLEKKTSKKNVIIYFHGGGWAFGAPWQFFANAQQLVHEGYYVFMPSYRRTPWYSYYNLREDVTEILKKIEEIMPQHQLADKNFVVGGISAGATLAALMVLDKKELQKSGVEQKRMSGLFLSGGPLDLSKMKFSIPLWCYAGLKNSEKFYAANPINYLPHLEKIPVLVIHGTKDGIVEYDNAVYFAAQVYKIQPDLTEFYTIENGTHVDSVAWSYDDGDLRKSLLAWLKKLEA